MDLIFTNGKRVDQGVLSAYAFDLSYGAKENDFEMTLGANEPTLEFGAHTYMDGTEYGGIVDGMKVTTDGESITYNGRTWHGVMNSKVIQPDTGADYLVVSGDANEVLSMLIDRLALGDLFTADSSDSGIVIKGYQFPRYCRGYDGIRNMLNSVGAKLTMAWRDRQVQLSAQPIVDYSAAPIDGDTATLTVKKYGNKVNHLICLGRGELANRDIIHLYADVFGQIGDTQYYTGTDEVVEVYDYSSVESLDALRNDGIKKLRELRDNDTADIAIVADAFVYDVGDIVGATEVRTGTKVTTAVTQKIVKITNGVVKIDYKIGSD